MENINNMTPQKGTKAHKAYEKGKESAMSSNPNTRHNPYILGSVIALSNWWQKGYSDGLLINAENKDASTVEMFDPGLGRIDGIPLNRPIYDK